MELSKRRLSCAIGAAVIIPALVASVSLPLAGESHQAYAAAPAKVSSVKTSNVTKSGFKVTWKKASSKKVKGYQLKIYKGKTLKKTYVVKGRTATSKSASGLSSNTKYTVKVRAYSGSSKKKYGKWSSSVGVTTKKSAATPKPFITSQTTFTDSWGVKYKYISSEVKPEINDPDYEGKNNNCLYVKFWVTNSTGEDQPINIDNFLYLYQNGKNVNYSNYANWYMIENNAEGEYTIQAYLEDDSPVTMKAYGFDKYGDPDYSKIAFRKIVNGK